MSVCGLRLQFMGNIKMECLCESSFVINYFSLKLTFNSTYNILCSKPEHTWGNASDKKWTPISKQEFTGKAPLRWYQINENPAFIKEPFTKRMKFWEGLKPEIMSAFKKTKKHQKTEL